MKQMEKYHYRLIKVKKRNPNLTASPESGVSAEIFDKLVEQFPQYQTSESFMTIDLPVGHPALEEFLSYVVSIGGKVAANKADYKNAVNVYDRQNWTPEEIDHSPLLQVFSVKAPQLAEADKEWSEQETIYRILNDKRLRQNKHKEFGCLWAWGNVLLVRGGIKQRLEQAGLRRLVLHPLPLVEGDWPADIEPLYRLSSDLTLPPMQNLLGDNEGNVFPSKGTRGPHPHGCFILDGYEFHPRPRYLRSEIDPDSFDVGITYERLGVSGQQLLIVSQKFRAVCKEMKLKLEWSPVVLE